MVKYAPLGVQMVIKWVGLVGFVRYLVTKCLDFQYPGGLSYFTKTFCEGGMGFSKRTYSWCGFGISDP